MRSSLYRPGERGWIKLKNPAYWRCDSEIEAMRRARERRRAVKPAAQLPRASSSL